MFIMFHCPYLYVLYCCDIHTSICEPCLKMEMSADPTYLYFLSPAPAPMLT